MATMNPYKGIVRISCKRKTGCSHKIRDNVQPECMGCPEGLTEILDLEGKVLFEYQPPRPRTAKKVKSKGAVSSNSKQ